MGGLLLAWIAGESLIVWRTVTVRHRPPMPGELAGSSALYAVLGLVAEIPGAAGPAALLGWGFTIAAALRLVPEQIAGPSSGTVPKKKTTTAAAAAPAGG